MQKMRIDALRVHGLIMRLIEGEHYPLLLQVSSGSAFEMNEHRTR